MLKNLTEIKNWLGKTILWAIGIIMIISQNYSLILVGFLLTEREINLDFTRYILVTSFGLLFIVGGIYLNKFLDKFTGINNSKNE